MDNGGQPLKDRSRQTATEIARKKLLAAYQTTSGKSFLRKTTGSKFQKDLGSTATKMSSGQITHGFKKVIAPLNPIAVQTTQATQATQSTQTTFQNNSTYKQTPINATTVSKNEKELQNYHSAWQNYYQKYYSDYYSKAAKSYIENEKLKAERQKHDKEILETPQLATNPTDEEEQSIMDALKQTIRKKATTTAKHSRKLKRLMPIIAGLTVVLIVLFLQYNRLIFAPIAAYVSPGNTTDTGITALDPTITTAVSADNRLMIPKLNVDVPVHFNIANDTDTVNEAMENGVAQFAIPGASALPGEIGNLVITGHSAGDIYSNNQYKFIFSGLERLVNGDLIYIDYKGTRYTYSVTKMETVEPSDVASLVYETTKPMLTLVTCTPLGTSRYRLLVTAEQISPAPSGAVQAEPQNDADSPYEAMPENEPTFFERIWNFLTGRS
ncbi:class E sortase [Candidatus Saccharibacteria bacterium]|nr:class E sortase [Candidatus Saccharibacteria bacterium]